MNTLSDTGGKPSTSTVLELVELARTSALRAGELIRTQRPDRPLVAATKSSPTDVVTAMDRAVEELLKDLLGGARPQDGLLGEEGGGRPGTSGVTWVLDPIDGTVNYLYGLPSYAVSVAAVLGDPSVPGAWTPLAGCVHNPQTQETWTAGAGLGADLNGVPLTVQEPPPLSACLVATGFGYCEDRRARQAEVLARLLPRVRDVRRLGCASIDLCMVASGRVDGYYERGLNSWDIAAGVLVAREAGAVVRGLGGRPAGPEFVLAAAEPLCGELAGHLADLGADRD
ncbi:MAG: monophosphatase [Actinomycetota bacterium]|nr:monophosphatase [Actinomycetota bacterium]